MQTIAQPTKTALTDVAGVGAIPTQSEGFVFNHTMLRVKDPVKSLAFYTQVLGMTLLHVKRFADMAFDLYFLAKLTAEERANLPDTDDELAIYAFRQRGILELTHNYGTEDQANLITMMAMHNHKVLVIFALASPILKKQSLGLMRMKWHMLNDQKMAK